MVASGCPVVRGPKEYLAILWRVTQAGDLQILIMAARRSRYLGVHCVFNNLRYGPVNQVAKEMSGAN